MMTSGCVLKVILDREIRRLAFNDGIPTWKTLRDAIGNLFNMNGDSLKRVYYIDDGIVLLSYAIACEP